jgi:hypothetical protein
VVLAEVFPLALPYFKKTSAVQSSVDVDVMC